MSVTYDQFLILACISLWPTIGHLTTDFVRFVVNSTEGDIRGNTTERRARNALNYCIKRGWIEIRNENTFFPTTAGMARFNEVEPYWKRQVAIKLQQKGR